MKELQDQNLIVCVKCAELQGRPEVCYVNAAITTTKGVIAVPDEGNDIVTPTRVI
jgi:hypothetical protein